MSVTVNHSSVGAKPGSFQEVVCPGSGWLRISLCSYGRYGRGTTTRDRNWLGALIKRAGHRCEEHRCDDYGNRLSREAPHILSWLRRKIARSEPDARSLVGFFEPTCATAGRPFLARQP